MNGLLTEREWRKQAVARRKRQPVCCGAQCVIPTVSAWKRLQNDAAFRIFLLLSAAAVAAVLPLLCPREQPICLTDVPAAYDAPTAAPRTVREIAYALPDADYQPQTFTRAQLLRGKMLLLDAAHPLPADLLPPNTFSIAAAASGMVPVAGLNLQSGQETIAALRALFDALRAMGAEGLCVTQGTISTAQQRQMRRSNMAAEMRTKTPADARQRVNEWHDPPGTGELLQEYAVEIRLRSAPDRPLEQTAQGQTLLQQAWRYGFVRADPQAHPFRFRYVGRAHATAMTYLNVTMEEYLLWLHQKGALVVEAEGQPRYLILCQPMTGTHAALALPEGAACEVSLDNMGYAIAACTF